MSEAPDSPSPGIPWEHLIELVDRLDEALHQPAIAKLIEARGLRSRSLRTAIRGVAHYLAGDKEAAAQNFQVLAEDLLDQTLDVH